jgi:hypothetical protein
MTPATNEMKKSTAVYALFRYVDGMAAEPAVIDKHRESSTEVWYKATTTMKGRDQIHGKTVFPEESG